MTITILNLTGTNQVVRLGIVTNIYPPGTASHPFTATELESGGAVVALDPSRNTVAVVGVAGIQVESLDAPSLSLFLYGFFFAMVVFIATSSVKQVRATWTARGQGEL